MTPQETQTIRSPLPLGTALLEARHIAHKRELRRMTAELPIEPGDRILDVPCGNGFFTYCLAERLGREEGEVAGREENGTPRPGGCVVGIDINDDVLRWGRIHPPAGRAESPIRFVEADAGRLPFDDDWFDAAWCAHSLISLRDPVAALVEMRRVVRPGGRIVVVENDAFHAVLFLWPADLELAICRAEREAWRRRRHSPGRLHPGRRLGELLARAGLTIEKQTTFTVDRWAPLEPADELFVTLYLQAVRHRAWDDLPPEDDEELARLSDPRNETFLPRRPDFTMTCIDVLVRARVPE